MHILHRYADRKTYEATVKSYVLLRVCLQSTGWLLTGRDACTQPDT